MSDAVPPEDALDEDVTGMDETIAQWRRIIEGAEARITGELLEQPEIADVRPA